MRPFHQNQSGRVFALALLVLIGTAIWTFAQTSTPTGFEHWEFNVDGASREALAYIPPTAKEKPTPVVLVFHGHGGNSRNAARTFPINREWPWNTRTTGVGFSFAV